MHIGWRRFRSGAGRDRRGSAWPGRSSPRPRSAVRGASPVRLRLAAALLLGTALAPTDPAVVFSVLGRREVSGRSGVLEGESGANDPVGIALMVGAARGQRAGGWRGRRRGRQFALQMAVGVAVGVARRQAAAGVHAAGAAAQRGPVPAAGAGRRAGDLRRWPRVAHGSGFLAVFVAGILIGDERAPYKREIARFHSALASLAEIVAFIVLGLTIDLDARPRLSVADRSAPGRPAGLRHPAGAGRPAAVAGAAAPQRAAVRPVGRPQGRGADPAGHRDRAFRRGRGGARLRGHLRGGGLLGRGPGRHRCRPSPAG